MTREEAIDLLDNLIGMVEDNHNSNYDTALHMAIKALEHEPCEITLEDVKEYCKPRCLTIITDELLYELTHTKIKALEQTDKIEESNFSSEQYKADLQSAYECGYQHGYADALNEGVLSQVGK